MDNNSDSLALRSPTTRSDGRMHAWQGGARAEGEKGARARETEQAAPLPERHPVGIWWHMLSPIIFMVCIYIKGLKHEEKTRTHGELNTHYY